MENNFTPPISQMEPLARAKYSEPSPLLDETFRNGIHRDGQDEVDALPEKPWFTCCDFISALFATGGFLADVVTDIILAYFYYRDGRTLYFILTLIFVIVPAVVTNIISLKWYKDDLKNKNKPHPSKKVWAVRIGMHLVGFGPAYRYLEGLYFGVRSKREKDKDYKDYYYSVMVIYDADASLLRLFEAFMEAAPQLVLQLYILATNAQTIRYHWEMGFYTGLPARAVEKEIETAQNDPFLGSSSFLTVVVQVFTILTSLLSIAWSMTSYTRCNRFSLKSKKNMSWPATIVHFVWHLLTIGARVLAIALFASAFTFWCGVACAVRLVLMCAWIMTAGLQVCGTSLLEVGFEVAVSFVYLFSYVNAVDEPTRWKYLLFYGYDVIEGSVFIGMWAWVVDPQGAWFYWPALGGWAGAMIVGLSCMVFYYARLHPNGVRSDLSKVFCEKLDPMTVDSAQKGAEKKSRRSPGPMFSKSTFV